MIEKDNKIYNLATKIQENHEKTTTLPNIFEGKFIGLPQIRHSGNHSNSDRIVNIFAQEKCQKQDLSKQTRPYQILCKKQIDAYRAKGKKARNIKYSSFLRTDHSKSFLSSSRLTIGESNQPNYCLTKNQFSQYYKSLKQKDQLAIQKHPKNKIKIYQKEHSLDLLEIKAKHKKYLNGWGLIDGRTSRISLHPHGLITNFGTSKIFSRHAPPLCDLQSNRKKVQKTQKQTLKLLKEDIKPIYWANNLRNPLPLKQIFDNKYVETIQREGFNVKGSNKLDKQYNWISQRKNTIFEPVEGKDRFSHSKIKGIDQSRIQYLKASNVQHEKASRIVPVSMIR